MNLFNVVQFVQYDTFTITGQDITNININYKTSSVSCVITGLPCLRLWATLLSVGPIKSFQVSKNDWIWLHHRILWGLCRQHIAKPATKKGYSWLSNIEIKKFTSGVTILNANLVRDETDCGSLCKCLYTSSMSLHVVKNFVNFLNNQYLNILIEHNVLNG